MVIYSIRIYVQKLYVYKSEIAPIKYIKTIIFFYILKSFSRRKINYWKEKSIENDKNKIFNQTDFILLVITTKWIMPLN